LVLPVDPGMPLEWVAWILGALGVLLYLGLAILASTQQEHDLRARLLFLFSLAVAIELALQTAVTPTMRSYLVFPVFYLLTGLQMGFELHLASVIPERQPW